MAYRTCRGDGYHIITRDIQDDVVQRLEAEMGFIDPGEAFDLMREAIDLDELADLLETGLMAHYADVLWRCIQIQLSAGWEQ